MMPAFEIGVDGHLLAGHRVQCESRGDFADTRCTFGDHDKLNDDDDHEDDDADGERAACDEIGERLHDLARRRASPPVLVRISRVVATFSTRRNSVIASSNDGNTANSSGLFT